MSIFGNGLVAAMEAIEEEENNAVIENAEVVNIVETTGLETDLIEAAEVGEVVDDMDRDLSTAEDAIDAMDSLQESLEAIAENGGLDRNGAILLNHAREAIYSRLGIKYSKEHYVSLEAFGDASSRQTATSIALEEEKSRFRKVIDTIWKFIKETAKKIKQFVVGLFSATKRTIGRAQSISKKSNDVKLDGTLTEAQSESFGRRMCIGDKTLSVKESASLLAKEMKATRESDLVNKLLTSVGQLDPDKIKDVENPKAVAGDLIQRAFLANGKPGVDSILEFSKVMMPSLQDNAAARKGFDKGEGKYASSEVLPGGMAYVVHVTIPRKDVDDEKTFLPTFTAGFAQIVKPANDVKLDNSALPRSSSDIKAICADVVSVCNSRLKAAEAIKKLNEQMDKYADKYTSATRNLKEKALAAINKIGSAIRSVFTNANRPITQMVKYAVTQSKYILDLCVIAMGNKSDSKK